MDCQLYQSNTLREQDSMTNSLRLALFILLLFTAPLHAAVYKCTDADGTTVYRDTSCPTAGEAMHGSARASTQSAAGLRDGERRLLQRIEVRSQERLETRKKHWQEELKAADKAKRKQAQLCAKARKNLARHTTSTTAAAHAAKRKVRNLCD